VYKHTYNESVVLKSLVGRAIRKKVHLKKGGCQLYPQKPSIKEALLKARQMGGF